MKVWMKPKSSETNKYASLLSGAIEEQGIEVEHFSLKKNLLNIKRNDVIHLHWIHTLYQSNNIPKFIIRIITMSIVLLYFKLKNVKLIWTVHNLYPHTYKFKKLEKIARKILISFSFRLIVAGEFIKKEVIKEFKVNEKKIIVIPHGHYRDVYPSKNLSVRDRYNIPEKDFVYLFIGAIKPYKGIDKLVQAFNELQDNSSTLLIAGKSYMDLNEINRLIGGNKKIHLTSEFVADDEIAEYIKSANAIVLPYEEITTSGSAILAISFERPLVAPSTSFFEEYFNDNVAVLYRENNINELAKAMEKAKKLDTKESDYKSLLSDLEWNKIAKNTINTYLGNKRS